MKKLKLILLKLFLSLGLQILKIIWFFTRPVTLGVEGMVFDKDGRILLVKHTYRPGWFFPGGGVNSGESVYQGLERELKEEVGIDCSVSADDLQEIAYAPYCFKNNHVCLFVVRDWSFIDNFRGSFEIEKFDFFAPDNLPGNIGKRTKARLESYLKD